MTRRAISWGEIIAACSVLIIMFGYLKVDVDQTRRDMQREEEMLREMVTEVARLQQEFETERAVRTGEMQTIRTQREEIVRRFDDQHLDMQKRLDLHREWNERQEARFSGIEREIVGLETNVTRTMSDITGLIDSVKLLCTMRTIASPPKEKP